MSDEKTVARAIADHAEQLAQIPPAVKARAVNAVGPALQARGEWLRLSTRQAVASAVLVAVKADLEARAGLPDVAGSCPACGAASLFLAEGGHVTCSHVDCPAPDAADELLHGGEGALVQALGGGRTARVIAHTLTFHGHSLADVRRMTDEEFRAVPGIGDTSLARIRCAFTAPPSTEPERPASGAGDILGALGPQIPETLTKGLDRDSYALAPAPADTPADFDLEALRQHAAKVTRKTDATVTVAPYGDGYEVTITRAGGTTRHGGYGVQAVHGMLLGITAAARPRHEVEHPLVVQVAAAVRSVLYQNLPGNMGEHVANAVTEAIRPGAVLRQAAPPVPREASDRPTHPDGTPYRYHEIVAEGWGHCDGCRTWGRGWTAENPHDCPGTYVKGPRQGGTQ